MQENKKRKNTGKITLSDVAKLAGVGTMTASRALRTPELVSDKLRKKIESAVNTLGYRPNIAASTLASARINTSIAIITSKIDDTSCKILLSTVQEELINAGYMVLIIESSFYQKKNKHLLDAIYDHNLAGLVLFGLKQDEMVRYNQLSINIPIINIDTEQIQLNTILSNNMLAMYQLTEYVINKGYRSIGLLCANHEHTIFQQRLHGWHKAMLDNHLPNHRVINAAEQANFTTGANMLAEFLLNWPEIDALICTTDELACGVLYECQRRHIRIPYQLAVAGFGDSEFSRVCQPPLTTVSLPYQKMAIKVAASITNQISTQENANNSPVLIEPIIKSRNSL